MGSLWRITIPNDFLDSSTSPCKLSLPAVALEVQLTRVRAEIDERLFGSTEMGNQAFNLVVSLFEALIGHCTEAFPGQVRPLSPRVSNIQCGGLADKR